MPELGLSCYTANLHRYLADEWDADRLIAESVRLAVRVSSPPLAFSHHAPSLDRLPDGSGLRYAAADSPDAALPQLRAELERHGRVLVLVDSARLPWSMRRHPAPHWVLVGGLGAGGWRVLDEFATLLPDGGAQRPYRGWLGTKALASLLTVPATWTAAQRQRTALAFGAPIPVPSGAVRWLARDPQPSRVEHPDDWITGAATLDRLTDHLTGPDGGEYLDDLWAAAGHHCFALRRLRAVAPSSTVDDQLARWSRLPQVLRIAHESAARGRPRPHLVRSALTGLASVQPVRS